MNVKTIALLAQAISGIAGGSCEVMPHDRSRPSYEPSPPPPYERSRRRKPKTAWRDTPQAKSLKARKAKRAARRKQRRRK